MLHAIVHSKAGRIDVDGHSIPIWEVYKGREDMLTAAVIARLTYLSPVMRQRCLASCSPPDCPLDFSELNKVHYWPSFSSRSEHRVEPDVLLEFGWGCMVIEVKRPQDGWHRAEQWFQELDAVRQHQDYKDRRLMLLALGGDADTNRIELQCLNAMLPEQEPRLLSAQLTWEQLASTLYRLTQSTDIDATDRRIIEDIQEALRLYGVDHAARPPLSTLRTLPFIDTGSTLHTLQHWSPL